MTNYSSNRNSINTTILIEDTLPDVLSTLGSKPTISIFPSSADQQASLLSKQLSPLSLPWNPQQTSPSQTNVQTSDIQNLQSSHQQQNRPSEPLTAATVGILSNSQELNSSCPLSNAKLSLSVPNTSLIKSTLSITPIVEQPPTKIHLNSTNNHSDNSNNELLMIKRFSNESGMNDKWSKK